MNVFKKALIIAFACGFVTCNAIAGEENNSITVTAQKIKEDVQDVPISMTVLDEIDLEDKKINTIEDIGPYSPNLMMFGYQTDNQLSVTMRGIYADMESRSNPVGIYVDGIPLVDAFGTNDVLNDIERVEVLRGPQGTLYGKNAETGVINIITNQPSNETIIKTGIEVGSDNKRQLKAKVSGAIIKDRLYVSVAGNHFEKDGILEDAVTGETLDDRENNSGKLTLRWTPSDKLDISLVNNHLAYDDEGIRMSPSNMTKDDVSSDLDSYDKSNVTTHALKINYQINDNSKVEAVSTYRLFKTDVGIDLDFTNNPAMAFHWIGERDVKTLAHEVRYSNSILNDRFSFLLGIYNDKKDEDRFDKYREVDSLFKTANFVDKSLGLFFHGKFKATEKINLLTGVRYDDEEKEYTDYSRNIDADNDYNEVSPKLGLEFKPAKGVLTYATISKGYRSGGFNYTLPTDLLDKVAYDKETLWSYEIGAKTSFLDDKLVVNGAVFYMDIEDMQVTNPISPTKELVTNAAQAHSQGIELSVNYRPIRSLSLFSSFGYTDAVFDDYSENILDSNGNIVGERNYKDNTTPFAPKYNFSVGAQYRGNSGIYARVDLNGYGEMYFDKANNIEKEGYNLVNAKLGYEGENFDFYLYSKNLFDENHDSKGYYNGYYTIYEDPREIGAHLTYRF